MRYMIVMMSDAQTEAGIAPSEELQQQMGQFIGKIAQEGILVDAAGLFPTSQGFRLEAKKGEVSVTDGPFTESKEIVGGYLVIKVADAEGARQVARDFIEAHKAAGSMDVLCEVRPMIPGPGEEE